MGRGAKFTFSGFGESARRSPRAPERREVDDAAPPMRSPRDPAFAQQPFERSACCTERSFKEGGVVDCYAQESSDRSSHEGATSTSEIVLLPSTRPGSQTIGNQDLIETFTDSRRPSTNCRSPGARDEVSLTPRFSAGLEERTWDPVGGGLGQVPQRTRLTPGTRRGRE